MSVISLTKKETKRCPSYFNVKGKKTSVTHQCDLDSGHTGNHESVIRPSENPDLPHEEAVYWPTSGQSGEVV
jgi:hypothetical protein